MIYLEVGQYTYALYKFGLTTHTEYRDKTIALYNRCCSVGDKYTIKKAT